MAIQTSPLIVGGGLSGLSLAYRLAAQGRDFMVLEARDRFGGRILGQDVGGGAFDLGPAWFWPGQPRIAALIARLGLGLVVVLLAESHIAVLTTTSLVW